MLLQKRTHRYGEREVGDREKGGESRERKMGRLETATKPAHGRTGSSSAGGINNFLVD